MFLLNLAFDRPVVWAMIVGVTILSVVLHELGHALVATWEGDPTPRISGHLTWNPVVHMGWFSMIAAAVVGIAWGLTPVTPRFFRHRRWGDVLVSVAGPATNLILAAVAAVVLRATAGREFDSEFAGYALLFWHFMLAQNVLLFLFNLIPVPPLDGFGVLEGTFDLGDFGARFRQMSPLPLLIAIFIVNSPYFDLVQDAVMKVALGDGGGD